VAQLGRLLRITHVFVRHDLDEFVRAVHLFRPYRLLLRAVTFRWLLAAKKPRGERLREALEELGPVFVKFGQMMSTRPDLLPDDIAVELAKLQDQVPPFDGETARAQIEAALAAPVSELFRSFEVTPLASASVAQVHAAMLHDGTEVVVKVLRPGIQSVIARDVALLDTLARLAERWWPAARRLKPVEVVAEYRKTIGAELDLMREAANASRLRANFEDSNLLVVPKVFWDYSRSDVMVMERVRGIPVSDVAALKRAGIDLRTLAHHGVEIFFTQAFRDGYFHADMHPGNIFVAPDGKYCAVDFGIMGTLSERDKLYLAENLMGFFNRDYRAVAEAHVRAGWVNRATRLDEFESAIRAVCEPIFARPISEISFGRLMLRLFQTARQFDMEVQPQLVLLQKTLFNIEGLGRQLYPDLNLWDTAKPYLEQWMRDEFGPRALWRGIRREAPRWAKLLPEMPTLMMELLRKAGQGEISMGWRSGSLERLRVEMRTNHQRLLRAVVGGSLLIAAAIVLAANLIPSHPGQWLLYAVGGLGVAFLLSAWPWRQP